MWRIPKALLLVATHVVAVVVGFGSGAAVVSKIRSSQVNGTIALAYSSQNVRMQYEQADTMKAQEAVQAHLDLVEALGTKVHRTEATLARLDSYLRLAALDERVGKTGFEHIALAQKACANAGWKDCSEAKLRRIIATLR